MGQAHDIDTRTAIKQKEKPLYAVTVLVTMDEIIESLDKRGKIKGEYEPDLGRTTYEAPFEFDKLNGMRIEDYQAGLEEEIQDALVAEYLEGKA